MIYLLMFADLRIGFPDVGRATALNLKIITFILTITRDQAVNPGWTIDGKWLSDREHTVTKGVNEVT